METNLLTHQGDRRDVVWSATRINLADDVFQLESFVDISLQKQAAKNLAYHNERLPRFKFQVQHPSRTSMHHLRGFVAMSFAGARVQ